MADSGLWKNPYSVRKNVGFRRTFRLGSLLAVVLVWALILPECVVAEEEPPSSEQDASAFQTNNRTKGRPLTGMFPRAKNQKQRQVRHARAKRQRDQWWQNAEEVLFRGIDLSSEQKSQVDELIQRQKESRNRFSELDVQLSISQAQRNAERSKEIREQIREARDQLESTHELFDAMRTFLNEQQRPTFDINRAKLVAESQSVAKPNPKQAKRRRPRRSKPAVEGEGTPEMEAGAATGSIDPSMEPQEQPSDPTGERAETSGIPDVAPLVPGEEAVSGSNE